MNYIRYRLTGMALESKKLYSSAIREFLFNSVKVFKINSLRKLCVFWKGICVQII